MTSQPVTAAPLVSVVVEGYNESLALGSANDTVDALRAQRMPLDQVEMILVGSAEQCAHWRETLCQDPTFHAIKVVVADGEHYYALKNRGAELASGKILVFTDSDARPEPTWLPSIVRSIEHGADVVGGLTLFRGNDGRPPSDPMLQVASSITWGFTLGEVSDSDTVAVRGFLSNNVGFRPEVFRAHRYRTDHGRTIAGSLLFEELERSGARIVLQPRQRVAHSFSLGWWLRLHFRFGYELFQLRRSARAHPHRWVARIPLVEPPLTMAWHMLRDVPQWLKYSMLLRLRPGRRFGLIPLLLGMSLAARGLEAIGMYATLLAPARMRRFAEWN
jgi:glycosyltransferase involved in cell wall biosynthesis